MNILQNIPPHRINNSYHCYVSAFYILKANAVQKEIGVENYSNGITPDEVKFNPEYRENMQKVRIALESAKSCIPKAKELKKIIREFHKLYDMGQRIKILKNFNDVERQLIIEYDSVVSFDVYCNTLKASFENLEL